MFANNINIATSSLSAYEKGKSQPTLETFLKLSDFYQVTLDYLVRGVEKEIPLSQAEIKTNHTDRIGFRLENRIDRQSRLLAFIDNSLEDKLIEEVRGLAVQYDNKLTNAGTALLLEEEVWDLELCADHTYVVYPNTLDNIALNAQTGEYEPGEYFYLQINILRNNPRARYTEIYACTVTDEEIYHYRRLVKKHGGVASLGRVDIYRCNQPIICQTVFYDLDVEKLKTRHPTLHQFVSPYIINDNTLALVVVPQQIADVNLVAQGVFIDYIIASFKYLLKHAVRL